MRRWQAILLIVSLVLNIFLVGAIAGSLWRWTHGQPGLALRTGWRARVVDALPAEQGEALRRAVRATVRGNLDLALQARTARGEAARLFVQPQFDPAAVSGQLARARAADGALRGKLEDTVVGFAATLPPDQRQALAKALRAGPLRQPRAPSQR